VGEGVLERVDLTSIFDEVAEQMRSDLRMARSALRHSGLKGSAFEETLRRFLRRYLPRTLDVSTGVLIDAQGNPPSRQIDVIISDAAKTPIFYASGEVRVIPIECVYSVIEVKAYVDTNELSRVHENMLSVRRLQKTAYYPLDELDRSVSAYGQEWDIWPVNYFLFAFDSIGLRSLGDALHGLHEHAGLPSHQRIDTVCVLDKGLILNRPRDEERLDALPSPGSVLRLVPSERALLYFYTMITHYLNQAQLPSFRFGAYTREVNFLNPTML
jgi:hypothetical protein